MKEALKRTAALLSLLSMALVSFSFVSCPNASEQQPFQACSVPKAAPSAGAWVPVNPLIVNDTGYAQVYDGKIYSVGGSAVQVYDPAVGDWIVIKNSGLGYQPHRGGSARIGDRIYIVHGWSLALYYDLKSNALVNIAPPPSPDRLDVAVGQVNGTLYMSGGWVGGDTTPTKHVEAYSPQNNTWWEVSPMKTGRNSHELVGAGGYLYAIGGGWPSPTSSVERYDPSKNEWAYVNSSGVYFEEFGALATPDGRIVAASTVTQVYNATSDNWTAGPSISKQPYDYMQNALAYYNGSLYSIGARDAPENYYGYVFQWNIIGKGDANKPQVTISYPKNDDNLTVENVIVNGTAWDDADVEAVEISTDGSSWNYCYGTVSWEGNLTLKNGTNDIYAIAVDTSGNWNFTQITVNANLTDTTKPEIVILSPADGDTINTTAVGVQGIALDNKGVRDVRLSKDNLTWDLASGTDSWYGMLDLDIGSNTIYANATDTSGNWNVTSIDVTVSIPPDTKNPAVYITSPYDGETLTSTYVYIQGAASDNVGVQKVEVSDDNYSWTAATGTTSWDQYMYLSTGYTKIYAKATDTSSNTNTTSVDVFVSGSDTTHPAIFITSPYDGETLTSTYVDIQGTASDNVGVQTVEVSLGSSWYSVTGTTSWYRYLYLSTGYNTIYAKATDTSGNTNTTSINVFVSSSDTTDPTVYISSPYDGETFTSTYVYIQGTASDNVGVQKVEVSIGSSWYTATGTTSWYKSLYLSTGYNTIYAKATDTSGNYATVQVTVYIGSGDTTHPTISITSPSDGDTVSSTYVSVSGTASDDVGLQRVQISDDQYDWQYCSGTTSWYGSLYLSSSTIYHTIYARATDTSGNTATTSVQVTTIHDERPSLHFDYPHNNSQVIGPSLTVRGYAYDDEVLESVEISTDGKIWINCTIDYPGSTSCYWSSSVTLSNGDNKIYARATDISGNNKIIYIIITVQPPPERFSLPMIAIYIGIISMVATIVGITIMLSRKKKTPPQTMQQAVHPEKNKPQDKGFDNFR